MGVLQLSDGILGEESARLLLELIDGREPTLRAPLPVELVVRDST